MHMKMFCVDQRGLEFLSPASLQTWTAIRSPTGPTDLQRMLSLHHTPHSIDPPGAVDTYVRMLFGDFSSAFNTVVPQKLVQRLTNLGQAGGPTSGGVVHRQ